MLIFNLKGLNISNDGYGIKEKQKSKILRDITFSTVS